MKVLVTKDSKGKIRIVKIDYDWNVQDKCYVIHRTTSQYGGKQTIQPDISIYKGKASRTLKEQVELEFNSHIKKYLDKGYKELPDNLNIDNVDDLNEIEELIGNDKTNQEGILKPMLAKQADKIANKVFNKEYYGSRKING